MMPTLSQIEENYIKAIYNLYEGKNITTNSISRVLKTTPASVTDMLKRLSEKKLVYYRKYKGVSLTDAGREVAVKIVRKHRLWEYFLVEKLNFSWHEVHEIAEQLEHIRSPLLTERLDAFLGYPKYDPHGEPIPDSNGKIEKQSSVLLSELKNGDKGVIVGVKEDTVEFLRYLEKMDLLLGTVFTVTDHSQYDDSYKIYVDGKGDMMISFKVSQNLFIHKK